jgi:hypothetical protein
MTEATLNFGPGKYAAFNLMLARWLRTTPITTQEWCYVTLGGTELYDIANLSWIDRDLVVSALSYETQRPEFGLAEETANRFKSKGIRVEVLNDDIFQYRRGLNHEKPHIYYIDITGVFWRSQYQGLFKTWFDREVIQPGDLILITSYLGARISMKQRVPEFRAEFMKLRISSSEEQTRFYEVLHPLFVLSRALSDAGLDDEVTMRCLGCVKYRANKAPMGLYGIVCESGKARLASMASGVPCFDTLTRDWYELPAIV